MYTVETDGTVVSPAGKVIFYSADRFEQEICSKDACFICGAKRGSKEFNDEHVIPKWILKKQNLYDKQITLTNQTRIRYSHYVVSCCVECNQLMGNNIEQKVHQLFDSGYTELIGYMKENGPWLFLVWLSLIFIKTHYKDRYLRLKRDNRRRDYKIGDLNEWQQLHHIYCIARAFYSGAEFDPLAQSSFIIVPAKPIKGFGGFDYCDLFDTQASMIRYNQIVMMAIHNDGCAAQTMIRSVFSRIKGQLAPIQIRELFARLAYANCIVENRPEFISSIDTLEEKYIITAKREETFNYGPGDEKDYGLLMYFLCKNLIAHYPDELRKNTKTNILTGRYSFLFNDNGDFMNID